MYLKRCSTMPKGFSSCTICQRSSGLAFRVCSKTSYLKITFIRSGPLYMYMFFNHIVRKSSVLYFSLRKPSLTCFSWASARAPSADVFTRIFMILHLMSVVSQNRSSRVKYSVFNFKPVVNKICTIRLTSITLSHLRFNTFVF